MSGADEIERLKSAPKTERDCGVFYRTEIGKLRAALVPFMCGCVVLCHETRGRVDRCKHGKARLALTPKID